MLLPKKTARHLDQWSVVLLSAPASQNQREALARKLCVLFNLSETEVREIMETAPILLADGISEAEAKEIKGYFGSTGAVILTTDDANVKAKCHRIVWPERPNLSLLRRK